jgi:hypothetical protein
VFPQCRAKRWYRRSLENHSSHEFTHGLPDSKGAWSHDYDYSRFYHRNVLQGRCNIHDDKHPQSNLYPSEVVTLGLLYALKGCGQRKFWRWLTKDYQVVTRLL